MGDESLYQGILLANRFEVGGVESEGQFGFVFKGRDRLTNSDVAIKILKQGTDPGCQAEFLNEGILLDKLAPASHVVDLAGPPRNEETITLEHKGTSATIEFKFNYLVLEWMDGSIADLLPNRSELSWVQKLTLVRHIAKGVHQMHLREVYHRDMKCDNVLVRAARGSMYVVKVADLGRSRDAGKPAQFTPESYVRGRGHLLYAPPELLWGLGAHNSKSLFRQADIYLIGSALFEIVTGSSITAMAFGDPLGIVRNSINLSDTERRLDFGAKINQTRALYQPPLTFFEDLLPNNIKRDAVALVRQLCDPDPSLRDYRAKQRTRRIDPGLDWLLNKIDILIRISTVRTRPQSYRRTAGGDWK